MNEINYDCK